MKRLCLAGAVLAVFTMTGCESVAEDPGGIFAQSERNVIEQHGFLLEMDWCEVRADRSAECQLTATSLTQDYKAGFSYPKMQDQTGAEYRMVPSAGGLGQYTMIAGEPYTILYKNRDILPTTVSKVRGVVGTWSLWDQRNIKAGEFPVVFADIPERPVAQTAPVAEEETVAEAPVTSQPTGSVSGSYWHGTIVPVVDMPSNEIVQLWGRGAYLHFREDGIAGYNWSVPGYYAYDEVNQWSETETQFTLTMSGAVYVFDKTANNDPLVTYLQPGGIFKMTVAAKAEGEE
ncbi:MAG: hypothetical protein MRY64_00700 [Hyphomonadaceae bacterium]|nr:hypothetical protein [Hyphomonadaceae bacterium]